MKLLVVSSSRDFHSSFPIEFRATHYNSFLFYCHLQFFLIYIEEKSNTSQAQLQTRYGTHRSTRNGQQKAKLLSPDFSGLILDPILQRLMDPSIEPGFVDPRNCLVFWARPPSHIRSLVDQVQQKLLSLAPSTSTSIHPSI